MATTVVSDPPDDPKGVVRKGVIKDAWLEMVRRPPEDVVVTAAQFDRLLALLALTEQERAFVRAATADDAGKDVLDVFADYLIDHDRPVTAEQMRLAGRVREEAAVLLDRLEAVSGEDRKARRERLALLRRWLAEWTVGGAAVLAEREACATIADAQTAIGKDAPQWAAAAGRIAGAIRARGGPTP